MKILHPLHNYTLLDILERNILLTAIRRDLCEDKSNKAKEPRGLHLKNTVKVINYCGVSHSVFGKNWMVMGKNKQVRVDKPGR